MKLDRIDLEKEVTRALADSGPELLGFEFNLPATGPAVTEKYVYVALEKYWTGSELHPGPNSRDEIRAGFTLVPPVGKELLLALPRPGKDDVEEDILEGAITLSEFKVHQEELVQAALAIEFVARIPTPREDGF